VTPVEIMAQHHESARRSPRDATNAWKRAEGHLLGPRADFSTDAWLRNSRDCETS